MRDDLHCEKGVRVKFCHDDVEDRVDEVVLIDELWDVC